MHKVLNWPVWFLELFTEAKSFRSNRIIGSYWLNRLGLHVSRLLIAHGMMRLRMWMLAWSLPVRQRQQWFEEGYLELDNFLDEALFQQVREETLNWQGETREALQGDTYTQRSVLPPSSLKNSPGLQALFSMPRFKRLYRFASGHVRPPLLYVETVLNSYAEGAPDPQKSFHSDTFHPTMKCWFFVDEVKPETGPFTYIPGSQRLSWKRLRWEYRKSLEARHDQNGMVANGSFRFTEADIRQLGLAEPLGFTVKPNTLLIANTFGVHRRGDSEKRQSRTALWGDSRTNPFLPFPGISNDWINELQYRFLENFRQRADAKAAAQGSRSPWMLVDKKRQQ